MNYITEKAWARINIMRKLKVKLDRKSSETFHLVFIRPFLQFGDLVWVNCTQYEKDELGKIQTEAARKTTGITKLISRNALYTEICWESLDQRGKHHYKMITHPTPAYLTVLIPQSVGTVSRYNLRNSNDLQTIDARKNQYYRMSFLPSSVKARNNLPVEVRQSDNTNSFKGFLKK